MTYVVEKAPHLTSSRSTRQIMMELLGCLCVLFGFAVGFYWARSGTEYGVHALLIGLVSLLSSVLGDALWGLWHLWDKKVTSVAERFKNWGNHIISSYGYISGLIFALLLPVGTPYYVVFVGSFIGTFVVKCLFGGFGKNIFNPAIAGRVLVQITFPNLLKSYLGTTAPTTIATGATVLTAAQDAGWTSNLNGLTLLDLFIGNYRGALGETFFAVILLLGIYMIVRKVIDWRLMAPYVLTFFVSALFIGLFANLGIHSFEFALRQVMMGGVMFGAVFCLTDPVTAPTSPVGKIIYSVTAAFFSVLIRYKASAPEGMAFSILLVNMLAALIDKLIKDRSNEHKAVKVGVISGVVVLSALSGAVFGAAHQTSDVYKNGVARYDEDDNLYSLVVKTADSASGYKTESQPAFAEDTGTALKKVAFSMDGAAAYYYELKTDNSLMYNASTGTAYVDFGVIINAQGVVGYNYIDSSEQALGTMFAKEIVLSKTYPYAPETTADLSLNDNQYDASAVTESGASAPSKSSKTVPAILTVCQQALVDSKLYKEISAKTSVDNLNEVLAMQNLAALTADDVTAVKTFPTLSSGKISTELTGFKVNSKDAIYVEATTNTVDASSGYNHKMYMTFGLIVTSSGIVGAKLLNSNDLDKGKDNINAVCTAITVATPFTATSKQFTDAGFVVSSGMTITGYQAKTMFVEVLNALA